MRYAGFHPRRRLLTGLSLIAALGLTAAVCSVPARAEDPEALAQAKSLSRAFRAAAQQVIPTVVTIKTTTKPERDEARSDENMPPKRRNPFRGTPFEDFFDDLPGFPSHPFIPRQQGVGSGVIIDPAGLVLTNNHVVEGADEVTIDLADGRSFKATEIKTDEETDLAIVRIKANETLPSARLGDSSKLEIGDWVLAVGNPFELEQTVSAGIISGKKRLLPSGKRAEYLQTDAAINPGNSGGPLVNLDGEVVGINTAIASSSGGYQGIGFAIPINIAKWVIPQLIDRGSVQRAYLGVAITELSSAVAEKLGVRRKQGVLVNEVYPDTPAAEAGLKEEDVITSFAGQEVRSPHDLQEIVERSPLGSKQQVGVIRAGKPTALTVEVKALPKKFGVESTRVRPPRRGSSQYVNRELGMELADLTPEMAERLGYQGRSGALITAVQDDGLAAAAGLTEGMLILKVGKKQVKSVADFQEAIKGESLKEGILLQVRAGSGNRFVVLQQR